MQYEKVRGIKKFWRCAYRVTDYTSRMSSCHGDVAHFSFLFFWSHLIRQMNMEASKWKKEKNETSRIGVFFLHSGNQHAGYHNNHYIYSNKKKKNDFKDIWTDSLSLKSSILIIDLKNVYLLPDDVFFAILWLRNCEE